MGFPGSEGLMVTGQDGIKTQETLAGEGPGKDGPTELPSEYNLHTR